MGGGTQLWEPGLLKLSPTSLRSSSLEGTSAATAPASSACSLELGSLSMPHSLCPRVNIYQEMETQNDFFSESDLRGLLGKGTVTGMSWWLGHWLEGQGRRLGAQGDGHSVTPPKWPSPLCHLETGVQALATWPRREGLTPTRSSSACRRRGSVHNPNAFSL